MRIYAKQKVKTQYGNGTQYLLKCSVIIKLHNLPPKNKIIRIRRKVVKPGVSITIQWFKTGNGIKQKATSIVYNLAKIKSVANSTNQLIRKLIQKQKTKTECHKKF